MKASLVLAVCVAAATAVAAQDPIGAAKDLYASAAYEEALTTLTRLHEGSAPAAVSEQVEQYRAFCLFALGRIVEAQSVAEILISKSPLVELEAADASPRIMAMFTDVRKRLLPGLIREQYRAGRSAIDKKDFPAAQSQFGKVRQMLDESEKIGIKDETLGDLRVLVDGFAELVQASLARAAAQPVAPAIASLGQSANASSPGASSAVALPPRIYFGAEEGVVAPVIVRQDIPKMPRELIGLIVGGTKSAILDVLVDENGNVERAVVRESAIRMYDSMLVTAAQKWKYRPAMKGDTPVKYLKTIEIVVKRTAGPPIE